MTLNTFASATVEEAGGAYHVLLDGRRVRTPRGAVLALPDRTVAEAVAEEWRRLRGRTDHAAMPMTRLANKAVDLIAPFLDETVVRIMAYAETDLLCHRAAEPQALVRRQEAVWQPVLDWAATALGVRLLPVTGVIAVAQPPASLKALEAKLRRLGPFRLAAADEAAAATGSVVLALALAHLHVDAEEAWAASRVDEDWQIEHWGSDPEADARAAARRSRLDPAARLFVMLGSPEP